MAPSKKFTNSLPPMSHSRSSSLASSSASDDSYYRTYRPLSNLPTPPMSKSSSRQTSPELLFLGEHVDPELFGPATHLTNLIPASTSLTAPSIPLVQTILARAHLPLETLALAVCILDSLSGRFALSFRRSCPLQPPVSTSPIAQKRPHIDAVRPELLVLCALILAVKFLDDTEGRTADYAARWGGGLWTCEQINYAQRALLEDIEYRILPLCEEELIHVAMRDMRMAGRDCESWIYDEDEEGWEMVKASADVLLPEVSTGKAVKGLGSLLTPMDTPTTEGGAQGLFTFFA